MGLTTEILPASSVQPTGDLDVPCSLPSRSDVLEVVANSNHQHMWALTLRGEGTPVLIRMNESTWRSPQCREPSYDVLLGRDFSGYQTWFTLRLNEDGAVNSNETLKSLSIRDSRQQATPWLLETLQEWVRSLDGIQFDQDYAPRGARIAISEQAIGSSGCATYHSGVVGNPGGTRSYPAPIDPAPLLDPNTTNLEGGVLVFYGGLGAVVDRFYKEHLQRLKDRFPLRFVCVDLAAIDDARDKIARLALPYDDYVPAQDFRIDPKNPPVGIVVLTRPDTHFPLAELANGRGVQSFIEKPVVLPGDLEKFLGLYQQRRAEVFPIDFFFDNPLVQQAITVINGGKLGNLTSLTGSMLEAVAVEQGRDWLLDSSISGGGLGMDMMVHITALAEMVLERWGLTLKDAVIDPTSLVMARYEGAPKGSETYARLRGLIPGGVSFVFDAGKGLHTSQYFLIIEGTNGTLEINLGTEDQPGFMQYTPKDATIPPIRFDNPSNDIGYKTTVAKTLASAIQPSSISPEERDFRVHATTLSVEILYTASYMFGDQYYSIQLGQDPAGIQVDPTRALSVSERTKAHFDAMESFANTIRGSLSAISLDSVTDTLSLDRLLFLELGNATIGLVVLAPRSREISVVFEDDCTLSDGDRATVVAALSATAQDNGWMLVDQL